MKLSDSAEVLYCDNHLLVAVKPAGLLTQPDSLEQENLEEWVKEWIKKEFQKPGEVFLHPVHRLDRPVSGLVLFARTSKSLSRLNEAVRCKEIQRFYIAEVEGIIPHKIGRLDHYLIHADHCATVGKEGDLGAKHARLSYAVLHYMPHSTLVQIELDTGRYHQIRAQFAAIGHPIFGDERYGGRNQGNEEIRLHASQLSLRHPVTEELLTFDSAPPFA